MTVKPRTIDNLGIDSSVRYAKDMEILDKRLIEESRLVPQKTTISVAKPYVPSDFELLFASDRTMLWATFLPPPNYFEQGKFVFSYQLIPSLGGYEKQDADLEKIAAMEDALKKPFSGNKGQQDQEKGEEEKEREMISYLLQTIAKLDKTLILINSRRNQYQRG